MPSAHNCEYLSFGDALFLYLERDAAPLNIASLAIFEGDITLEDIRNFVASKLPQIPRYLQKVVIPPLGMGTPYWDFTPDFKLSDHISEVRLKHGTVAELKTVTARVMSQVLDRSHPLWHFTLIHGLKHGRTGLIARVHHCLADGISGMSLLNVLMTDTPSVPVLKKRRIRIPHAGNGANGDVIDSAMRSWFSTVERLLKAGNEVLTIVQRTTGLSENGNGTSPGADGANGNPYDPNCLARLAAELSDIPDRLPFNIVCRGPQRYEWTEVPMQDIKAVREKTGTMVNDIVLTLLTAAFRRYSELHGVNVRGRSLRIVVPVSTRRHHNSENQLGNQITFAPFSSPLGIRDPKRLLAQVHERMHFVKTTHVADFVSFAGTLLGAIPTPLQAVLAPMLSEMPISLCNTICTNVPGPKQALYLLGHRMLSAYPYVPIGGEMGINCAVLSYNGTVYFGFTGDVHAAPDLQNMPKFVDESMAELKRSLGLPVRQAKRTVTQKAPELGAKAPEPSPEIASAEPPPVSQPQPERKTVAAVAGAVSSAA